MAGAEQQSALVNAAMCILLWVRKVQSQEDVYDARPISPTVGAAFFWSSLWKPLRNTEG